MSIQYDEIIKTQVIHLDIGDEDSALLYTWKCPKQKVTDRQWINWLFCAHMNYRILVKVTNNTVKPHLSGQLCSKADSLHNWIFG